MRHLPIQSYHFEHFSESTGARNASVTLFCFENFWTAIYEKSNQIFFIKVYDIVTDLSKNPSEFPSVIDRFVRFVCDEPQLSLRFESKKFSASYALIDDREVFGFCAILPNKFISSFQNVAYKEKLRGSQLKVANAIP